MKIVDIRLAKMSIPLVTPFKTALRSVSHIEDLVVMVTTDCGAVGYGSAPATPVITGDTHGSIAAAITTVIKPKLLGGDISQLNQLIALVSGAIIGNYSAKAALEVALYDLWAQWHKKPLYQVLGGGVRTLTTDITISVNGVDEMVRDSLTAINNGFDVLKIKIGDDMHQDIARVSAIYQQVQGKAKLRLDVNQGWSAKQSIFALQQLEQAGVQLELIEQPVKADDFHGMKTVCQRVLTPIMADESAFSPKQVIALLEQQAADIINIKLVKTGGLSNAIKIADIAGIYDVPCMIGCMLEGSIGAGAAAHLAAAKSNIITKIDLDGPALGQYDPVVGGVEFDGPNITLNDSPGLGITHIEGLVAL